MAFDIDERLFYILTNNDNIKRHLNDLICALARMF